MSDPNINVVAIWANDGALLTKAADEIEKLRVALRPFANALQGHYHHQVNEMPIVAGYHKDDLRFKLTLGDFRKARAALGEKE
jgi:NifU-like protein involved in Fe-S cluster formation